MEKTRLEVEEKIEAAKPFIQSQTVVVHPSSGLTLDWVKYNPHPKGMNVKDCVKRAISVATAIDYSVIKSILVKRAATMCFHEGYLKFNHSPVFSKYLTDNNFTRTDFCKGKTIFEISKIIPKGIVIVVTDSHMATLIDGKLYDSWFSGNTKVKYIFHKYSQINHNAQLTNEVKSSQFTKILPTFAKGDY